MKKIVIVGRRWCDGNRTAAAIRSSLCSARASGGRVRGGARTTLTSMRGRRRGKGFTIVRPVPGSPAVPEGMAKALVIAVAESRDGGASHVFVFDRGPVVVGRDPGSSLIIDRDVVSGVHGVFDVARDGAVTFCDLGSRNGTLLNGRSLPSDEPVAVAHHDILSIGNLRLQVLDERPKPGFGPEAANPFAPTSSSGAATSLPDETATASPADVAAARSLGRVAKQADARPSEQRVVSPRAPSAPIEPWPRQEESAPTARDLPLAEAGGTEIMGPEYDGALHPTFPRTEQVRSHSRSGTDRPRPGVHSRAQRGGAQRVKGPTVVSSPSGARRLAWAGIAAGAVIASAIALGFALSRGRERVAAPTAGASDESRAAPSRAVEPTPAAHVASERHEASRAIAAPDNKDSPSSSRTVGRAASPGASAPKQPSHSKGARRRDSDAPRPDKVGEVGIMP